MFNNDYKYDTIYSEIKNVRSCILQQAKKLKKNEENPVFEMS